MYSYFFMEFLSLEADFIDCRLLKTYVLKVQLTITCSRSIIKALEQGVNYVMVKVNNKNIGTTSCSRSDVFIFNFEHVSCLVLMFLLLIFNKYLCAGRRSNL